VVQIKYPKLSLFVLSLIVAYLVFSYRSFAPLHNTLILLGYFGTFLTGFLYAYGFTAPLATAILLILAGDQNIIFAGLVAGLGALLSDLIIFLFIRHSFTDEIERFSKEKFFQRISGKISSTLQRYMLIAFASLLIASPLPTEIGIVLMASLKSMSTKKFAVIAYLLHTAGIFVILLIGRNIN
jgi:uncharacterized membrane protein YdjX (TVP38/TMEM64 family)